MLPEKKKKKKKMIIGSGDKESLHQPESLFSPVAFASTFQPKLLSGLRIMLLCTVEVK